MTTVINEAAFERVRGCINDQHGDADSRYFFRQNLVALAKGINLDTTACHA